MGEISKQTIIDAPSETVFKYVADPHHAPRYISSITSILSGPRGTPTEGQVWRAEANFLGRRSTINLRLTDLRPNHAVRFAIEGDPQATLTIRLAPNDTKTRTRVALLLEATGVPTILLNALMSGLLDADLVRLKRILES